jgi:hypothetical protein
MSDGIDSYQGPTLKADLFLPQLKHARLMRRSLNLPARDRQRLFTVTKNCKIWFAQIVHILTSPRGARGWYEPELGKAL